MRGIARDLTNDQKLLSVPEVARLIGRSETATRRAIECGLRGSHAQRRADAKVNRMEPTEVRYLTDKVTECYTTYRS
jgi:hypothetical protein